jgi:hypothetical protein
MNERVKELAVQVYGSAATAQEIKFAELIVRECIDVVSKATASPNGYQALMKHFWS